jgi:hypothetical protein
MPRYLVRKSEITEQLFVVVAIDYESAVQYTNHESNVLARSIKHLTQNTTVIRTIPKDLPLDFDNLLK